MRAHDEIRQIARSRGWTVADRWRARLAGWIGRRALAAEEGLCLLPCNAIHTFGMRVPIDVVFVDRRLRVVRCVAGLPPRRLALAWRAVAVVELPAGAAAEAGLRPGVHLSRARPVTDLVTGPATATDAAGPDDAPPFTERFRNQKSYP